jgi:UDP-glucose 4-epimerase
MTHPPILITGAAGFLGSHLTAELLGSSSADLILMDQRPVRKGGPEGRVRELVMEITAARWGPLELPRGALICHLAGLLPYHGASGSELDRVNVGGTRKILELADHLECPLVLFVSSPSAFGIGDPAPLGRSSRPFPRNPYGRSKLEAEELVKKWAGESGRRAIIVRSALLYGPGLLPATALWIERLAAGRGKRLLFPDSRRSYMSVVILVTFLRRLIEARDTLPSTGEYFVADRRPYTAVEWFRILARSVEHHFGVSPTITTVPGALSSLLRSIGGHPGSRRRDMLTACLPARLAALLDDANEDVIDPDPIARELGVELPDDPRETVEAMTLWYRRNGFRPVVTSDTAGGTRT